MEITLRISNRKIYQPLIQFLQSLNIEILVAKKNKTQRLQADGISLASEKSLAKEWNSKEDKQWDKVL